MVMIRTLKCILAGDGGVGKTSLVRSFMGDMFNKNYLITVGVDVSSKIVEYPKGKVNFSVNDIAGQPRFESFRSVFFKGAHLALLVFDLTRTQTLRNLDASWVPELAQLSNPQEPVHCILVGNKSDLEDFRSISSEEGRQALTELQNKFKNLIFLDFIETSALENRNVDEAFSTLAQAFLDKIGKGMA